MSDSKQSRGFGFIRLGHLASAVITMGLAGGIIWQQAAWAQADGATTLEGIVVEGVSLESAAVASDAQGSAVSVVTGEQLARMQVRNAAEALRALPGVTVNRSGGLTGLTQVRIRGAEANHTLVLIDGVEANATFDGEFDFSDLAAENIERIEVIRGPQSGLFGSNALAGVVNVITKRGRGPLTLTARGEAGSFETGDVGASLSGGSDRLWGTIAYHRRKSNGFNIAPAGPEEDASELSTFSVKGGIAMSENFTVDLMLRRVAKAGDRDTEGGSDGTLAVQVDNPSHFASSQLLASGEAKWTLFDGLLVQRFRANHNETVRDDAAISSFGTFFSRNIGEARKLAYLATLNLETAALGGSKHILTGLVEQEDQGFIPVTQGNVKHERRQIGYAAQYRAQLFERLFLSVAARRDDNDSFTDFTTWRVSGALKLGGGAVSLRPHASAGTGVKFPTMFEQFGVTAKFIPSQDLQPEESFGWDAGAEISLMGGRAVVDVTRFEADLENEIETLFLPFGDPRCAAIGALFCSTVENRSGKSHRRGIEVTARFRLLPGLHLAGSYTRLNATEPDGSKEIRRPNTLARVDVDFETANGRGKLHLSGIYNGERQDVAFELPSFTATRTVLDDSWLMALSGSWALRPGVELFGRVENLLDTDYREVFGFETAPRAVYGGVKLKLGLNEPTLEPEAR